MSYEADDMRRVGTGEGWLFGDTKRRETAVCNTVVMLLKCEQADIEAILRVNAKPMRILHTEYARRMLDWHGITVSSARGGGGGNNDVPARRLFDSEPSRAGSPDVGRISQDVSALSSRIQVRVADTHGGGVGGMIESGPGGLTREVERFLPSSYLSDATS